jgi:hypothetical protein
MTNSRTALASAGLAIACVALCLAAVRPASEVTELGSHGARVVPVRSCTFFPPPPAMRTSVPVPFGPALQGAAARCTLTEWHIFLSVQMKHWQLSGSRARKAMASFFHREEVHNEANHLEDYADEHPFLGDHPRPSMSAAIQRYCTVDCPVSCPRCPAWAGDRGDLPRKVSCLHYTHAGCRSAGGKLTFDAQGCPQVSRRGFFESPPESCEKGADAQDAPSG